MCYIILDFYYKLEIYATHDFPFFSWFQLLSKTISAKTTYGNALSFGLYNNSQRWEMVKFVKERVKSVKSQVCPGIVVIKVVQVLCLC